MASREIRHNSATRGGDFDYRATTALMIPKANALAYMIAASPVIATIM
ncbi:hypothetical protein DFR48_1186 [Ciceribacter lividus]|uniref:Uncharacterized protein n=1 Tax=Ciceribacter lividus TaxID=1197950 RepID=A0A6I7HIQ5_9HYPH|nr:hypothetical protein [Ciceribacter lividus]RCW19801.1 hypothetical protein DFR48_1186 [Ciceribacter lividus]